jgi:hypothetical protein
VDPMSLKLTLPLLAISIAAMAVTSTAQSSRTVASPQGCGRPPYVGIAVRNPFTARHITKSTSGSGQNARTMPGVWEVVARDSAGRIREEKHSDIAGHAAHSVVLRTRDGGEINTTRGELNVITTIFDCAGGKMIQLQPGMKIARLYEVRGEQAGLAGERPYSFFFTSLLRHNPTADVLAEDLGHKIINGIDAVGVKTTQIGSEEDQWKGRTIRIFEKWVSDELAATLLETGVDFKKKLESTSSLVGLSRVEPDPALFEIPGDYKVNPTPDEIPFTLGAAKPGTERPNQ